MNQPAKNKQDEVESDGPVCGCARPQLTIPEESKKKATGLKSTDRSDVQAADEKSSDG